MIMRIVLLLLCLGARVAGAERIDALVAAGTDAELKPVLAQLADVHAEQTAAWSFWVGTVAGHRIVVTRTEGDPLNAVAATTLAIRHFAPRLVIVIGPARAHDPALHAGDVVVAEKFAAFDGMVSPVTVPGGGSDALKWEVLPHFLMTAGEKETAAMAFPADAAALVLARRLHPVRGRIVVGVIGSAGQVNREADRIAWLRTQWGTSCEDGESAQVAGCAALLGVPATGWRVIDGADGEAAALVVPFLEAWK
jgi:adenosylhomocysteine nucleosidase